MSMKKEAGSKGVQRWKAQKIKRPGRHSKKGKRATPLQGYPRPGVA